MGLLLFVFGVSLGSFLGALTWRWPRDIAISEGRSFCPKCKKTITWYDNIPLVSYLALGAQCRFCGKEISPRYFLIELASGIMFSYFGLNLLKITGNIDWLNSLGFSFSLVYVLVLVFLSFGIFIIDLEHQYIPDRLSYWGLMITLILMIIIDYPLVFVHLLSGFSAGLFLLSVNLLTKGKGMGLGDVKLALFFGTVLGYPLTLVWMFLSFVIGAFLGVILLASKQKKLGQHIAFGPFLVVSFFIVLLFGDSLSAYILPYI